MNPNLAIAVHADALALIGARPSTVPMVMTKLDIFRPQLFGHHWMASNTFSMIGQTFFFKMAERSRDTIKELP